MTKIAVNCTRGSLENDTPLQCFGYGSQGLPTDVMRDLAQVFEWKSKDSVWDQPRPLQSGHASEPVQFSSQLGYNLVANKTNCFLLVDLKMTVYYPQCRGCGSEGLPKDVGDMAWPDNEMQVIAWTCDAAHHYLPHAWVAVLFVIGLIWGLPAVLLTILLVPHINSAVSAATGATLVLALAFLFYWIDGCRLKTGFT
jgi:hypothetical protein